MGEDRKAHLASQYMQRVTGMRMQQMGQQMAYPQQGYFVQAPMPQPQRFFNQAQANVRGAQPRWPQQPRGAIPPGQMPMGMNAGFRTRGPSGPRMNQAQAAAATAMVARPMGQQVMPAMMRGVGQIPPHLAAPPQEQKQMLGERLFPLISGMYPELAGKITGMLLEIDNSELVHMLEHNESLKGKVDEAVAVLQAHQSKSNE